MDKSEVIRVLDEAKKVLIEKGWAQGYSAKDGRGVLVAVSDPTACAFCAVGALLRASKGSYEGVINDVLDAVGAVTPGYNIPNYNDAKDRTKEDILEMFDKAKEPVNGQA